MNPRWQLLDVKISTEKIDKKYKISKNDKKLGKGNFGTIVRGVEVSTNEERAIKIIKKEKLMDGGFNLE